MCSGLFVFKNTNKPGEEIYGMLHLRNVLIPFYANTCKTAPTFPNIDSLRANQVEDLKQDCVIITRRLGEDLLHDLRAPVSKLW
jgi:hypothetical protein